MNTDLQTELIDQIKNARIRQGVSQSVMAEKLGISQPSYGRFEKGQTMLDIIQLMNVCKILMISIHSVLRKIYRDSDFEFIDLKEQNQKLQNELKRREDYIKILKYNIEDTIIAYSQFDKNEITPEEIRAKLTTLVSLLNVISKHDIP